MPKKNVSEHRLSADKLCPGHFCSRVELMGNARGLFLTEFQEKEKTESGIIFHNKYLNSIKTGMLRKTRMEIQAKTYCKFQMCPFIVSLSCSMPQQ